LNWAENYESVIQLYQTADHPTLSPKVAGRRGVFIWRILVHHMENPPEKHAD
jgi:hypothetical protein